MTANSNVFSNIVQDELCYLKNRLFEDAMIYLETEIDKSDEISAIIHSREAPKMRQLEESSHFYTKQHSLFDDVIVLNLDLYNQQKNELKEELSAKFKEFVKMNDMKDYNALYFDLIYKKETLELQVYLIIYSQTKIDLIHETMSALELLKKDSPLAISSYLCDQAFVFDSFL